jgi:aminopeptidase N
MLVNHLSLEPFLKGVSNYLKKHAYGNARTADLWAALSEASGIDVASFMDPWIRKIGFPVVTVGEEPGQISVRQSRFLTTGDVKKEEDETTWWIPLGLKSGSQAQSTASALTAKEDTIRGIDDRFYKLNADQSGFYRTNYPPERLTKLAQSQSLLSIEDKIGLMGDASALAIAGDGTTAGLLAFIEGFQKEESYIVWTQISSSIYKVRSTFSSNKTLLAALKKYTLKLVSPAAESIGWTFAPNEDYLTGQLRKLLLAMAAGAGHEAIIAEGKRLFAAWQAGDNDAIHQNLRSVVFNMNVAQGGEAEYAAVKNEYLHTTSVDGKEICLQAMGRTKDAQLARHLLEFVTADPVPPQDAHSGPNAVAANIDTRGVLWEFTKSEWERVHARLGTKSSVVMDRWVKSLQSYSEMGVEAEIREFFKDKNTKAFQRSLVIVSDTITGNAQYKERDENAVGEWLKANRYT